MNGTVQTVSGNITLQGRGGDASGGQQFGVYLPGGTVQATGTGKVSVTGQGGANAGVFNAGVALAFGGKIVGGTSGANSVIGTGGASDGSQNDGVYIQDSASTIATNGGNLTVTGTGGGTSGSSSNRGVIVATGARIAAGGAGTVSVSGTGGTGIGNNTGVALNNADSTITSSGGVVSITGEAKSGNNAVEINSGATLSSGSNAGVTITADSLVVDTSATPGTVSAGTGSLTIRPRSAGTQVNFGGADVVSGSPLALGISTGEFARFTAGSFVVGRDDIATGSLTVSSAFTLAGTTALTLRTASNIAVNSGLSVADGNLTLSANRQATPTSGSFVGVDVNAATVASTGTGLVSVSGRGGDAGAFPIGVRVRGGGIIRGGTGGTTLIDGIGGTAGTNFNIGVRVENAGSLITSIGSNVSVIGTGGGLGGLSNADIGVLVGGGSSPQGGTITAGGTGTVSVTGTGGSGTNPGTGNSGVRVVPFGTITSNDGAVTITGTNGTGNAGAGLSVLSGSISSGGANPLTVEVDGIELLGGTIRGGTLSDQSVTIRPRTAGTRISLGGSDVLAGSPLTLGLTTSELATISAGQLVIGSGIAGTVSLNASTTLNSASLPNLSLVGGADIAGTVGATLTASNLSIRANTTIGTSALPFLVSAGTLVTEGTGDQFLGETDSVAIGTADLMANSGTVHLTGGTFVLSPTGTIPGSVDVGPGATLAGNGTTGSIAASGGTVSPGNSPGQIETTDFVLSAGSTFAVEVDGTIPGTGHDQIVATGSVILGGATLDVSGSIPSAPGQILRLIDNRGSGAVSGTFASLPEGSLVTINGQRYVISYVGGTGNDVTLTQGTPPAITTGSSTFFTVDFFGSFTISTTGFPTPGISFTGTLPGGVSLVDNGDGTATLAGTPNPGMAGIFPIDLTASNGVDPAAFQTFTLSVSSQNQSIVFPPLSPVVYSPGGTVVLGATASSGLPVAYTVVSGPGTVIGNVLTILGSGQIAIRADQVGDGTFAPAAPVTQTLEVIAATQTISFPAPPSVGFATGIFVDLAATASSSLPIEYSIVSGPGFLNGNRLVATAPGTIVVRANQPGDAGFLLVSAEMSVEFRPVGQSAFPLVAIAGNAGGVTVRNASLVPVSTFESPGGDGAHAAIADFNGDGVADALIATGPGTATRVLVIDGVTGETLLSLSPFESSFTGGASVAAADVNGDGIADIAVGADAFGGPRVAIFDGATGANLADFFGIDDASFRGGVRVALGDVNGDGLADLAVAAGIGGGPRIALWSGASLRSGSTPTRLVDDFFAFESTLRDGANVALGDVDGDGKADMIFSGGPGGAPRILVWNAADFLASNGESRTVLANFFAADEALTSGARVVAKNLDGDEIADLVIGIPTGSETSEIRAYLGKDLTPAGKPPVFEEVTVELGGVYVG